ncbi:single-stranded DNA-binding protein [Spiroplasma endosymbiont of Aspidapion aeneum]|uniref:single-stranded DNA-binding protein n=1 Tax=Spiroplasma endosymbiont of Aspidapion aeneum TaxID=3066276 RepID=UPI00313D3033
MNCVNLIGRVTKNLELKKTTNGKNYVFFTVAVNSFFNGEKQSQFIPCVAWNNVAENISKYVSKGSLVSVEGAINIRNDKKDDGTYITNVNVSAQRVEFLSRPGESSSDIKEGQDFINEQQTNKKDSESSKIIDEDSILWDY